MASLKEKVKNIRASLKKEFPEVKFSVRMPHYNYISVNIVKSPYFDDGINLINYLWMDDSDYSDEAKYLVKRINEIIREIGEYYDNSDSMTDYFDCAFYYNIEAGSYNKEHEKI